jgi:hypothetical protein
MHLTSAQSKRFYDLFNHFTTYVNKKHRINDNLSDKRGHRIDEELLKVTTYIWEHRELIDEFVDENPLKLKRQELETIHSWRHAIKGRFLLMEHLPHCSAFLINDRIFEVVGITQDLAEVVSQAPTFVETTLLPFEGRLIYSVSIVSFPFKFEPDILEIFEEDYKKAKKKGTIAGNLTEFIKASKDYDESEHNRELDRMIDEHQHEQRKLKGELPAGVHKGVLVGKKDEERWDAIRAGFAEDCGDLVRDIAQNELEAVAWHRKPRTDLKGTLKCMSREDLEKLPAFGGRGIDKHLKKDDLINLLMDATEKLNEALEPLLEVCSPMQFEMFCMLLRENGIFWIPEEELTLHQMECLPIPPYLNLYYNQHRFAYVLPKEIFAIAATIDMDEIISRREILQVIDNYAMTMADLYGIVSLDDFFTACVENHPDVFEDSLALNLLTFKSITTSAGWELWENDGEPGDDDIYIINTSLLEPILEEDEEEEEAGLFNYRQYLLERHQQIPLKRYDIEEICQVGLFDYVTSVPEVRALRDYLDAHVPDDQDDLYFADNIIEELYRSLDWELDPNDIIDSLVERGLSLDGDTIDETNDMLQVLDAAMNAMPRWVNNGWTPVELLASKPAPKPRGELISFETAQKIGRNDPGPCGSGKKYKKCHGRLDKESADFETEPDKEAIETFGATSFEDMMAAATAIIEDVIDDDFIDEGEEDFEPVAKVKAENEDLLNGFATWLEEAGLSESTVDKHYNNVSFYIQQFLLDYHGVGVLYDVELIGEFLGSWFIRRAMWSNASSIKSNATSFKKFYKFLEGVGYAPEGTAARVKWEVESGLPYWLKRMKDYEEGTFDDLSNPFL